MSQSETINSTYLISVPRSRQFKDFCNCLLHPTLTFALYPAHSWLGCNQSTSALALELASLAMVEIRESDTLQGLGQGVGWREHELAGACREERGANQLCACFSGAHASGRVSAAAGQTNGAQCMRAH